MQAALTGHLVFSTVHTNDAPSAYTRLLDLDVEEFLLNAALISIHTMEIRAGNVIAIFILLKRRTPFTGFIATWWLDFNDICTMISQHLSTCRTT